MRRRRVLRIPQTSFRQHPLRTSINPLGEDSQRARRARVSRVNATQGAAARYGIPETFRILKA